MKHYKKDYGTWSSNITANDIANGSKSLTTLAIENDNIYWLEGRPTEGGRTILVANNGNETNDITPSEYNIRTRVHEYGGGSALVVGNEVFFINFSDQRIYHQKHQSNPTPITSNNGDRFADLHLDKKRRCLICVREHHSKLEVPTNSLVSVDIENGKIKVIHDHSDFVSNPRVNESGDRIAWLTWDFPNMPWNGNVLWIGVIDRDGSIINKRRIAGGQSESIFQPEWSPDGNLIFVSDKNNWWNLYKTDGEETFSICSTEAEFGLPQWVFGQSTYGLSDDGRIVASCVSSGFWRLGLVDNNCFEPFEIPFNQISDVKVKGSKVIFVGASGLDAPQIICLNINTGKYEVIEKSSLNTIQEKYISIGQSIKFSTSRDETCYGFYYPPKNDDYPKPAGELPPAIIRCHGGPTGATSAALNLSTQFWTSRGFAFLDINYRGSTGFGRKYRESLHGLWGVSDIDDMVSGAKWLVQKGFADPERLIVRGSSAGGYTTLASLPFRDVFKAGASYYGIGDLLALARDTHKFESRYMDSIIGPMPENEFLYYERSPINFTEKLNCPVIFLQGLDDEIVPPNQAESMVRALTSKGLPVSYLAFEGEGHGFRKAENVKKALLAELTFYCRVFGFTNGDIQTDLEIHNLD